MKKFLVLVMAIMTLASCARIDAGHEGIKVNLYGSNKGVDDIELVTGRVHYNPFTTSVYEHLLDRGFKVFVCEVLRKNKKWRKHKFIKGFAHLWLPEIKLAIRYSHTTREEGNRKLKAFLLDASRFVYTGVINRDTEDPIAYIDDLIERVFEYSKTPTKRGLKSVLVKPKPKKKRARMVGAQKV